MDSIDALIVQAPRSGAIAGIAVGSVPVWNGTAWVKPTGTPDGTKFLRDDGSWQSVIPTWANWTPTLTGSVGNPTLGAGATQIGRYFQFGKLVVAAGRVTMGGAGFVNGSGDVRISLPIPGASTSGEGMGTAGGIDVSATALYTGVGITANSGYFLTRLAGGGFIWTWAAPFIFAQTDEIEFQISYEAA